MNLVVPSPCQGFYIGIGREGMITGYKVDGNVHIINFKELKKYRSRAVVVFKTALLPVVVFGIMSCRWSCGGRVSPPCTNKPFPPPSFAQSVNVPGQGSNPDRSLRSRAH